MAFAPAPKKQFSKTYQAQMLDFHLGQLTSNEPPERDKGAWGIFTLSQSELGMNSILRSKREVVAALANALIRHNLDTAKYGAANALRNIAAADSVAGKQAADLLNQHIPALISQLHDPTAWRAASDLQKIAHISTALRKRVMAGLRALAEDTADSAARDAAAKLMRRIASLEETAQDKQDEISRYIR